MAKIYIDNSSYMEFIDEIATQMTEITYKEDTFESVELELEFEEVQEGNVLIKFTDEAQDYYNERYDEVETMLNNTLNIHSNEHLNRDN
jgi:hypothetical protein